MIAAILGVVFILLAILTITGAAHFAPAIGLDGKHHVKHTVLYAVIGLLCFVWARMSTDSNPISSR